MNIIHTRAALVCTVITAMLLSFDRSMLAQSAIGAAQLKLADGFSGELIYSVPKEQGSWVSLTHDPQGRLIASDQSGGLFRITPGETGAAPKVEAIDLKIGFAQGLLCAFDSLYVVAHGSPKFETPPGLFRLRDTDNNDLYDSVELLRKFEGGGEHGPHAVILSPDKKSLYICAGNHTALPDPETSRLPRKWDEDQLLTRFPDANGHAAGRMAPGGWICKTDPDGKSFELVSSGFRNQYDIAFDPNGELFTYDADMEWDVGLPWYRPTRVCHVTSGSDFGWRHGSGKWPEYYPDSVPGVVDIGPGSPTGITFGTGAKFPASYQNCLFISDWSYGIIYAIRMEADGSSYRGLPERFCAAPALPVTDLVINPTDGAMYFLIGGRGLQSGLYRVRYVGDQATEPANYPSLDAAVATRRELETFHLPAENGGSAINYDTVWPQLSSPDRFMRFAARVAIEHQPVADWVARATSETNPDATIEAIIALARCGDQSQQAAAIESLERLDWTQLTPFQRLAACRAYGLVLIRMGSPTESTKAAVQKLAGHFPAGDDALDRELAKLLIAVEAPGATEKIVPRMVAAETQEQGTAYAMMLTDAKTGWTVPLREQYFQWFLDAAKNQGGHSLSGYIRNIRTAAVEQLTPADKESLAELLAKEPETVDPYADLKSRPVVKNWTMEDLQSLESDDFGDRDLANGKKMFAMAACYKCHRISGSGGIVGPDLTLAGHRFNTHDLLETIVEPSKVISDQYGATIFVLLDGRTVTGRVANLGGGEYRVQEDMIAPQKFTGVKVDDIDEMQPSKVSMMPTGLLDTLTLEEIKDLLAYMKSTAPAELK